MSIFGSLGAPDDDEHEDGCVGWLKEDDVWSFIGPCDCGQPNSPLIYQGSHVLPSESDKRDGHIDIALVPSHITRDGRDDKPEDEAPWPYLRFGVNEGCVILTRRNVEQIARTLNWWLDATAGPRTKSASEPVEAMSDAA